MVFRKMSHEIKYIKYNPGMQSINRRQTKVFKTNF